jgi:hypothetical protein
MLLFWALVLYYVLRPVTGGNCGLDQIIDQAKREREKEPIPPPDTDQPKR